MRRWMALLVALFLIANVTFESVGETGKETPLELTINELTDATPEITPIEATVNNGIFRVESGGPQPDILINEIMYAPSDGWGGWSNEWIELYNNGSDDINLSGWSIDSKNIPDVILGAGEYLIIARNDKKFFEYYEGCPCNVVKVAIRLRNSGEVLMLNDSSSNIIDSVDYTPYADAGLAKNNNRTLERNSTGGFEESEVDGGTPCEWNSIMLENQPRIIAYAPESPVYDNENGTRTFNITIDQTANVTWLINGTQVDFDEGVTEAEYTNTSARMGIWNVSAIVENPNGMAMQTWTWYVFSSGESWFTIHLEPGYNLISIPLDDPSITDAQSLIEKINLQGGSCTEVVSWNGTAWLSYAPPNPLNNVEIEGGKGYFVHVTIESDVTFVGTAWETG
ncbi:MAG: lamin tail domain-containing protein [Candidatus Syntropharchaeia archaeon]